MNTVKNSYVQMKGFKPREKQLTLCMHCGDINYKGFWYASNSRFALSVNEKNDSIEHRQCPACLMLSRGVCAGELRIKNVPQDLAASVFLVIRRAAEQDHAENPQHRVLNFTAVENGYSLTTTSKKMIRRIQKSVMDAFESSEAQSMQKESMPAAQIIDISFPLRKYFNRTASD